MWKELSQKQREEYKKMILAFASLTEMFPQKKEILEDETENEESELLSPIINSKYQETVFQRVFNASAEDIGNTSYDAALKSIDKNGNTIKYLVGIKTFGVGTGNQKIAQFKTNHNEWADLISKIRDNALDENGNQLSKDVINKKNDDLYLELAKNISKLRNERIESSKAQIRGFNIDEKDTVCAVYHVLMPSKKGDIPQIHVGEISYDEINVDKLKVLGCTSAKTPINFNFTDGNHTYRFTSADSQLLMDFKNKKIIQEDWDVKYAEDAYEIFSEIANKVYKNSLDTEEIAGIEQASFSWKITNSEGEVERYSGFNGFYGVCSKAKRTSAQIDKIVEKLKKTYSNDENREQLDGTLKKFKDYMKLEARTNEEKRQKEQIRNNILKDVKNIKITEGSDFVDKMCNYMFRPVNEMYIPIPLARKFHQEHPDFFGKDIGTFKNENGKLKLAKEKHDRTFTMVFEPSGDEMEMFIGQEAGKGIESNTEQSKLGKWLMENVFRLEKYEPLTAKRLNDLQINGIRLSRYPNDDRVHLNFIWIDDDELPDDYISKIKG